MKRKIDSYYNKYLSIPIAARAALWFVICSMLQKCISFITVPIFTRIMSTDQYGIYNTYLSVYSVFTVICTLSMEKCSYVNGVAKAKNEREKNEIAVPLLSLAMFITSIVFIVYIAFRDFFNTLFGLNTVLMCLLFVQVLFEPSVIFWSTKQRFEFKYISMVAMTIGMVSLNAVLGIIFVYLSDTNQAIARVLSIVLVQVIFGLFCYIYYVTKAHKVFSTKGWGKTLRLQMPLLPHSLSLTVLSSSDRIMINTLIGSTQAAIYSVAYSAGYVVTILKNSISSAMTPWMYEKIRNNEYADIKKKTNPILLLVTIITFVFISFAPEIVYLLAPIEYHEAIYVIPPVAASSFFTFLYNVFSNVSFYYEETKKIMIASISGAFLNIVLNAVFIPKYGYIAAGYTTLVCYIMFTIAHYFIMKSVCNKHLNSVELFDLRYIILISLFVIFVTIVFTILYSRILMRYSILILCCVFLFIKRKYFIEAIGSMKNK